MENQKPPPLKLREDPDPRVVEAELRLHLSDVQEAVRKIEEAEHVSRKTLELEMTT